MTNSTSRISDNFTWREATVTATGYKNDPDPEQSAALVHTFQGMESIRSLLDAPIIVNSAFRSPEVNAAVGGAKTSQHMKGEAVDFRVVGMTVGEAFLRIAASSIPFDQLIEEARTWVHVSFVRDRKPRRQALVMREEGGKKTYQPFPTPVPAPAGGPPAA